MTSLPQHTKFNAQVAHVGIPSRIVGMGAYLPARVVRNDELTKLFDTSDEWIRARTGIVERRYAAQGEGTAELASHAAREAMAEAGWGPEDIDLLLFATLSPDHLFPGSGCFLQAMLGLGSVPAMDLRTQCTGFLYGLATARAFIASGQYQRVLLVGAEIHSHTLEHPDAPRDLAVLFGDGAAAVALERSTTPSVLATVLHADGRGAAALKLELFEMGRRPYLTVDDIPAGRHLPVMDNAKIFLEAVRHMEAAAHEVLAIAGKDLEDVALVVPHQANLRISEALRRRLGLEPERVYNNIQTRGNLTAASLPMALYDARSEGRLPLEGLVLLLAFGRGFTWGGALLSFEP